MESRLTRSLPLLAVIGVFVCAAALHAYTAFGAESPESAVQQLVEEQGDTYAGDCAATVAPRDIGATCSKLIGEENGVQAYLVGRTFGEFTDWIFVQESDRGDWLVVAEMSLDFHNDNASIPWP